MKTLKTITAIFFLAFLSSCTMALVEEVRGGHSPMQQLNGTWDVNKNLQIENGSTTEMAAADGVWFNATADQGSYCEGQWLQPDLTTDPEFLWSFSADGSTFLMRDATGNDVEWTVLEQKKNYFHIQREENGTTFEVELSK